MLSPRTPVFQVLAAFTVFVVALVTRELSAQIYPSAAQQGAPASFTGYSLSSIGDLNGDGINEVIAGTPLSGITLPFAGRVQIFSGQDLTTLFLIEGSQPQLQLGVSVAGLGDIDGDGVPDFAAGSDASDSTGTSATGHVTLYSGLLATPIYSANGDLNNSGFGSRIVSLGDVDNDNADDFAISAPYDFLFGSSTGMVRVFSGATGSTLYTLRGNDSFDVFGTGLAAVDDLDGDGAKDLIVGAPRDENAGGISDSGTARAFSGATGQPLWVFDGSADGEFFGTHVVGAGDINGDGFFDVAVAAAGTNGIGSTTPYGSVRILSGSDGGLLRIHLGNSTSGRIGGAIASAGDYDGDGVQDLLMMFAIGAPIPPAPNSRAVRVFSGFTGNLIAEVQGTGAFGYAMCSIGDQNSDGYDDFAVSDSAFSTPSSPLPSGLVQTYQAKAPVVRRVHAEGKAHLMSLTWLPTSGIPTALTGSLLVAGAIPGSLGIVGATFEGDNNLLFGYLPLLLNQNPAQVILSSTFGFDGSGSVTFTNVTRQYPALVGMDFHVQVFATSPIVMSSNALIFEIAP